MKVIDERTRFDDCELYGPAPPHAGPAWYAATQVNPRAHVKAIGGFLVAVVAALLAIHFIAVWGA